MSYSIAVSNEGDKKPVDVDAMIEAKRQRMAGGSRAQEAAEAKAAQAAAESARRQAEAHAEKPGVKKEEIYDRLAREAIFKKQSASLLAQVTLVSGDEEETDDELMPSRPTVTGPAGSSKRKRRSGTARHRRSGSHRSGGRARLKKKGGGVDDGSIGVVMAILGILLVLGLVFLIL